MRYLKNIIFGVIIAVLGIWAGGCAPVTLSKLEKEGAKAYDASDYEAALEKWQAGLAQARDLEDKQCIGQFLYNIALVHDRLSQYQEALEVYRQALEIYRERDDKRREARTLNNIGIVYDKLSQYQQALVFYRQALTIRQAIGDTQGAGDTLGNIGIVYFRLGQYQKALEAYRQTLSIRQTIEDKQGEGNTLNNMGIIYESQGQYQQALDAYQQALDIRRSIGDKPGEGRTRNNLGVVYWKLGQTQQALNTFQQALKIKRETRDTSGEATLLNNIGTVHWRRGEYQQALNHYQQALTIRRNIGDKRGEGSTLNNIGKAYESQHQYQDALDSYQQALKIRRGIGDRRGEASTLNNLGGIYRQIGQYQKASEIFQTSIAINKALGTIDNLWRAQRALAAVEVQLNQPESAVKHYEQAIDNIEALRAGLTEKEHKLSFMQDKLYVYDELIDLLQTLHHTYPDKGYDRKALEIFERKQGRIFLEEMGKSGARLFAGLPEEITENERDLEFQLEQIREQLVNERSKLIAEQKKKLIQSLEEREKAIVAEQHVLQEKIKTNYPDYYALKYPKPASLAELQQDVLQPGELLLVYNVMKEKTVLWLISLNPPLPLPGGETHPRPSSMGDSLQMYTLPVGTEVLQKKVAELRQGMLYEYRTRGVDRYEDEEPEPKQIPVAQLSYELYTLLFPEEVRPLLTKEHALLIVPTGPLYTLPFEALVTENPPPYRGITPSYTPLKEGIDIHYLLEDIPMSYLSSASLLKTLRDAKKRRKATAPYPLLAFADPVYGPTPPPFQEGKTHSYSPSREEPSQSTGQPRQVASEDDYNTISFRDLRNQMYRGLFLGKTADSPKTVPKRDPGKFPDLPETAEEAKTIKTLLEASDESEPLQLREKASRDNVFEFNAAERLDDYQYIVFATHGVLPGEVDYIKQPALVLSYPENDGYLTMADVFGLRLNARLVSLSACNTGSGEHVRGEGVMGLTRAFMYAGTPVIAVTLWSVESFSAKELDVGLFEHIKTGQSPIHALQAIKLRMLRGEKGEDYTHPYYWAPFVMFGDGR